MAKLTLVPTPIGNLADITLRALEILKSADVIAAEDTRHSGKLLNHYTIENKLVRLDAHTIEKRGPRVLESHQTVAFITDAGTPGISDPGAELVRMALARGDEVEVLPGATAFVPALILSGLPTSIFTFEGFLPRKGGMRRERLERLAKREAVSLLYESPKRLTATLRDLAEHCGAERKASVSRELTKRFETTYRGALHELVATFADTDVKGEIVIVIAPADATESPDAEAAAAKFKQQGLSGRELREALIALGVARNEAYRLSIE